MYQKTLLNLPKPGGAIWLASLCLNLLALGLPLVMLQVFDRIIPNQSYATLDVLALALLFVIAWEFVFKQLRARMQIAQGLNYEVALNGRAVGRFLNIDQARSDARDADQSYDTLAAIIQLREYLTGQGRLTAIDLPFALLFVAMIWVIGGHLVVVPIVGIAVLFAVCGLFRQMQKGLVRERKEADADRYALFAHTVDHISAVKSGLMEQSLQRRYEVVQRRSAKITRKMVFYSNLMLGITASSSQIFVAAIALFGGYLVILGETGIAELAACMLLNGRAVQPAIRIITAWSNNETVAVAEENLMDLLSAPQRMRRTEDGIRIRGEIEAQDVTLRTSRSGRAIVKSLSFSIKAGETVWLRETGSGMAAASLLRAIAGEQTIDEGSILIDGSHPMAHLSDRGENGIVVVDEKVDMFGGSILFNIAMSVEPEQQDRAFAAAEAVGLSQYVKSLPLGYQTEMSRSGLHQSSKGFLQLVNLARGLTRNPRVLLLNDCMSSMDAALKRKTLQALEHLRGDVTIIHTGNLHGGEAYLDQTIDIITPAFSERPGTENVRSLLLKQKRKKRKTAA